MHFLSTSDFEDFDARIETIDFSIECYSTNMSFPIDSLTEEIKLSIMEKYECKISI